MSKLLRVLCVGDIHLGSSPSRLPNSLPVVSDFSARAALQKTVELAQRQKALVLLFAGDVADASNALFEAYSGLAGSIEELLDAGIKVFAIAGNHDYRVLPDLAQELPDLKVLGINNSWEEVIVNISGFGPLRVQGRSFDAPAYTENPLIDYPKRSDSIPTLALLHCDVNASQSQYAPVTLDELKVKAPTAFILGHIHKPNIFQRQPLIFYPGSLQGLNPSENGPHGPWLLELDGQQIVRCAQFPIAPLRYERIEISLLHAATEEDIRQKTFTGLKRWYETQIGSASETRLVIVEVVWTGQTDLLKALPQLARSIQGEQLELPNCNFVVDRVTVAAQPLINLEELSRNTDIPGLLANQLLILQNRQPSDSYKEALQAGAHQLELTHNNASYSVLETASNLEEEEVRSLLLQAGFMILDELLHQKQAKV